MSFWPFLKPLHVPNGVNSTPPIPNRSTSQI